MCDPSQALPPAIMRPPPPETTDDGRPLGPDEQQLLADIRSLRTRLLEGELVIEWPPVDPGEDPGEIFGSFGSADEALSYLEADLLSHPPAAVIYLKDAVSAETAERLLREVEGFPGVTEVTFISEDVALTRLKEELKDHPEVLDSLDENPLPASIEVYVEEAGVGQRLAQAMDGRPEVDETRFPTLTPTENIRFVFEHLRDRARPATEP